MSKKHATAVPDFSRKRPPLGAKSTPVGARPPMPNTRQQDPKPVKAKNGGRRGT